MLKTFQTKYDQYFSNELPKTRFIITPHAGISYSGFGAFCSYSCIDWDKIKRIILLSTNHYIDENLIPGERFSISNLKFEVPQIDLMKANKVTLEREHSWQFQLELLEYFKEDLIIELFLISSYDENIKNYVRGRLEDETIALVANTDLSHINGDFEHKLPINKIIDSDYQVISSIISMKPNKCCGRSACGSAAIKTFLNCIGKDLICKTMCYYNSSQVEPNLNFWKNFTSKKLFGKLKEGVSVGYGAFAFYPIAILNNLKTIFSPYECYNLTEYCHNEIKLKVFNPIPIFFPGVELKKGIFVTINKNNELRGCIGTLELDKPIYETLGKYTLLSAYQDSRFGPIKEDEYPFLTIEISLLDNKREVSSQEYFDNFKAGEDGIEINLVDGRSAFFLPSVSEEIPNKIKLLEMLCEKLGSKDKNCWKKEGTKFYINNGVKLPGL